jgi:pyruvate/2-oxoglutarate dehydrogenase complex dihydrolipoamide acyltransferase (E2) component
MSGRHRKPPARVAGRHRKPSGPTHWLAPGLVVVVLLGAGGVGAHAALSNSGSDSTAPAPPSTSPATTAATPTPTASTPTAGSPSASSSPSPARVAHHRTVALRMVVTGSVSWIEVRRPGGRVLASGLVRHGHRLTYTHGPLDVVIGNAAAVQLTRHGATHKAGRPGQVVNLSVK